MTYDRNRKITWYNPKLDPWVAFNFRIYPSIATADDGARKIVLSIVLKDPPKGRPTSLQVTTEDVPWLVPILASDEIRVHDSGCRVTQTIFLQNQIPLVQKFAGVSHAEVALVGYQRTVRYKMTAEDMANFKRIAGLWSAPRLPPAPPKRADKDPPEGSVVAGTSHITNPELISKVQPKFPRFAEGKSVLGRVVLKAVVRKDGTVGEIEVVQSAGGDCGFEESAIEAVRKWRYKPGMKDGQPVDVYFTIVIDFTYDHYRMPFG